MAELSIFVFSVTGDQGRAAAIGLHAAGWKVTGLTRNAESNAAQVLKKDGINIVQGDYTDPSSYERHLQGHHAAFVNTDFFAAFVASGYDSDAAILSETRDGIASVSACVAAGVRHIIYSALDDFEGTSVPFCDGKAQVVKQIRHNQWPVTNVYTSTYYSSLIKNQWIQPDVETGGLRLTVQLPDEATMPAFDVDQLSGWLIAILQHPNTYIGKDVQVCSDKVTISEMARTLSAVLGLPVRTLGLSTEKFYSEKIKQEIGLPIWLFLRANYEGLLKRDVSKSAETFHGRSFADWARSNKDLREAVGKMVAQT